MRRNSFILTVCLGILAILVIHQSIATQDGKLHIVFCDVGQGDGVYIRTPSGEEVLFDGGPDDSVLSCLDAYSPFWDRSVEVMILSHPHYDHFRGLIDVLMRYQVGVVLHEPLTNNSDAYREFSQVLVQENAKVRKVRKNTKLTFPDGVNITVLGPDDVFIAQENPNGITENDNPPSLILHVKYNSFDLLLTGDSDGADLIRFVPEGFSPEVLQIPHHGSQHGYTADAAKIVKPHIAVISSGKNNSYGHPHSSVLAELERQGALILRTDQGGHIHMEISEDGAITIQDEISQ